MPPIDAADVVVVAVAKQHVLAMIVEVVPRDGDQVSAAFDDEEFVGALRQVAVIDPDVVRARFDVDGIRSILDREVADDDVVHFSDLEPPADDHGVGPTPDDGLVRLDP